MCGIVGYIGKLDARKIVLDGLTALEYRGYDSAGIALKKDDKVEIFKDKGRVDHLKSIVDTICETHLAIGHTRWATHGIPSQSNSHPHTSNSGRFILVHNGVIENYKQLKVTKLGNYTFKSETDTEVIVNLIEHYAKRDMPVERAIRTAISLLEGSYALLIIDTKDLNKIYFGKNVIVDKEIMYEWERIPHFYYDFYVYKYVIGLACACKIANDIYNKAPNALENYKKFLKSGGSNYPSEELKYAGIDITKPDVLIDAIKFFDETVKEYQKILRKR